MRALGIEAYSCDIEPCSGGHPEWHILGDVTPLLEREWDLIMKIAGRYVSKGWVFQLV
jgi:hypothetical protein